MSELFSDPGRPLLVVTAQTGWDEAPRMRHYVAKYLSNYFNVIFCELYRKGRPIRRKISNVLIVYSPGLYVPGVNRFPILCRIYNHIQKIRIVNQVKTYARRDPVVINFKFDFYQLYETDAFALKYLFINDDFVNMTPSDAEQVRAAKKRDLSKSIRSCDRVFVSSDPLLDDVKCENLPVSVIYSGHDFRPEFNREMIGDDQLRVCFMGFITENIRLQWIQRLVERANIKFSFVGPVESKSITSFFARQPNVCFDQPMVGKELQQHISSFDVFVMPYTNDPVNTKASVPAKLFQYLACGRPIVTSSLPNLIQLPPGFVYSASTAEEFVERVFQAKNEDCERLRVERITYAMENGWEQRALDIHNIILRDAREKAIKF